MLFIISVESCHPKVYIISSYVHMLRTSSRLCRWEARHYVRGCLEYSGGRFIGFFLLLKELFEMGMLIHRRNKSNIINDESN